MTEKRRANGSPDPAETIKQKSRRPGQAPGGPSWLQPNGRMTKISHQTVGIVHT
ncbi:MULTISPECIES: hypothetical protein [unclassified Streptomyces]|uniref:hypothetical protein n=1 Tax=unclassified Streptomyces TaxID=2593676 RepID=UPI001BFF4998|nr:MULTISPECIES: hypothetical protein [unclassified Streptomyces]